MMIIKYTNLKQNNTNTMLASSSTGSESETYNSIRIVEHTDIYSKYWQQQQQTTTTTTTTIMLMSIVIIVPRIVEDQYKIQHHRHANSFKSA
jgi:hypothetical protein